MGLEAHAQRPVPAVPGLHVRPAVAHDVDAVLAVDAVAYGTDPDSGGPWLAPMIGAAAVTVAIAELDGAPVATGYVVHTDDVGGPAMHLGGIGVLPAARGRGIAAALSSWLMDDGWARGAQLAELQATGDAAAHVYARLGFFEAGSLDVYVEL
jgi:GNAT superfamily N-acetyltransferase